MELIALSEKGADERAEEAEDEICEETCEEAREEFIMEEEVEPGSETGLPEQPMQKVTERSAAQTRRKDFFICNFSLS
ncbi:MAG TPA: hypothetical protein PK629_00745 [Oscillospiraceae bacterium]|nr:hypothetical protein [Oscillospiraceae bacterium]HPF56508.1 hypothetical protein [Clostridiales bacterium]HPK34530.1 hypothetical protein [Oscillospiraceae bacterium]HPR74758.1 hypothetical protein [Oscillospiraceae bacterium]